MRSKNLTYILLLVSIIMVLSPLESKSTDLWDDWGVTEGQEYEFSLDICSKYGSTMGINYTLDMVSNLVAIQGEHWTVSVEAVNDSGFYQTITKGTTTTSVHEYPTYKSWFWGQAGNRTYWQEKVDANNDLNLTETHPETYLLDEWTLIGDIYTEHRVTKNSAEEMKKFSIHIGLGITTSYELKFNETLAGDAVAYHHLKFTLVTELESSTTTTTTTDDNGDSDGVANDFDSIISNVTEFFTENPEFTIILIGGFFILILGFILIRRRGGKKRARRRR